MRISVFGLAMLVPLPRVFRGRGHDVVVLK